MKKLWLCYMVVFNIACDHFEKEMMNDNVKLSLLIRRVDRENNPNLIRDANSILNGHINFNARWQSFKYENEIDWTEDPYKNSSWLNALFSLRMIAVLTAAYELESNPLYLEKGKELLQSWDESFEKNSLLSKRKNVIWSDHAVSNRVINLIYFYYILKDSGLLDKKTKIMIAKHLEQSGYWLYDYKNYTVGNHAVMMDRALLYLSYILKGHTNSMEWREKALDRFDKIIHEEVTDDGVCVENSPQYHPFMMDLLMDFIQLQINFNTKPSERYTVLFERMKSYLVYVLKPDLKYPPQGDSYPSSDKFFFSKKYPDPRFDFIESNGIKGKEPDKIDVIYKESGYAILRDDWKKGDEFDTATYINFISGFLSRVHKHSDNLSLSLYANGEDILIDPGNWGYTKNDTVTYLNSTRAHNTFTINNTDYVNFPLESCKITYSELAEEYSVVEGVFRPNPFDEFHRRFVFLKPNILILDDHVFSSKKIETTEQIFNLGLNMKSISINSDKRGIKAVFEHNDLEINQLTTKDFHIENYKGLKGTRGLYALKAEQTTNGNQIVFKTYHSSPVHHFHNRTLIKINNELTPRIDKVVVVDTMGKTKIRWRDRKNKSLSLKLDIKDIKIKKDILGENLKNANTYLLNAPNITKDFGLEEFRVLKWRENEYSLIFKLHDSTSEKKLQEFTIGIIGKIKKTDSTLLSTYARKTNRDYEAWNIKENKITSTPHGKYISVNLSTKIKNFKSFKLFLFHRSGYRRELWNHIIEDFYLDSDLENEELLMSLKTGIKLAGPFNLSDDFDITNIFIVGKTENVNNFYIEIPDTITDTILKKYKIGLHTFVRESDKGKLLNYSKTKNRNYDAWDFLPEIKILKGKKFIIKKITTSISEFPKIEFFLYDSSGYKGLIGNKINIENVKIQ